MSNDALRIFVRTETRGQPLPKGDSVKNHFSRFGEVSDVYNPPTSPDICYVTFKGAQDVQLALSEPMTNIDGVPCNVQQAVPRNSGPGGGGKGGFGAPSQDRTRIYVTGLEQADEDQLRVYFSQFGSVKDVYMPADKMTGQKKPFAFVTMMSSEEADAIVAAGQHQIAPGLPPVNTTTAAPRDAPSQGPPGGKGGFGGPYDYGWGGKGDSWGSKGGYGGGYNGGGKMGGGKGAGDSRVFVFGMPQGLNADMLRGHFARHGDIRDIYIPANRPDIAYISYFQSAAVMDALQHSGLQIAGYWVQGVKPAEPKDGGKGGGGGGKGFGGKGKGSVFGGPY
eukprot:TRINITY_DN4734_c0_g2_i1.p1 TRINITY_DN4734_c0_g2~~TRINITY_DN4734_c0_g2_i1.p1  ORF type:complete len:336 (+),score=97.59 TRINITY_DN4734_c0_g2_i1:59-1066(+)